MSDVVAHPPYYYAVEEIGDGADGDAFYFPS